MGEIALTMFDGVMLALHILFIRFCLNKTFPPRIRPGVVNSFYIIFAVCLALNLFWFKIIYANLITNLVFINLGIFLYSGNIKMKLIVSNFMCVCLFLSEDITLYLISFVQSVSIGSAINEITYYFAGSILSKIAFFASQLAIIRIAKPKIEINISFSNWFAIIFVLLGSCCMLHFVFERTQYDNSANIVHVIFVVVLAMVNITAFIFFIRIIEYYEAKLHYVIENTYLEERMKSYVSEYNLLEQKKQAIHGLRHDLKHILLSVKIDLEDNNRQNALRVIHKALMGLEDPSGTIKTGVSIIDGILNHKATIACNHEIPLEVNTYIPSNLLLDTFDFSVILGNAMDNAMEATRKCAKEDRHISVALRYEKGVMVILFSNTFIPPLQVAKNGQLISTKTNATSHGLGLKSIEKIVHSYNGYMEYHVNDNKFELKLLMYLPKNNY